MFATVMVHQSMTRRKACQPCIKAKRRCDLRLPLCSRCMMQKRDCQYDASTGLPASNSANGSSSVTERSERRVSTPPQSEVDNECSESRSSSSPYDSFPFPELGTVRKDQVDYCMAHFQDCISTLVQKNHNNFIHYSLYERALPSSYQDLLSICALYFQKTAQNKSTVFRMLDEKATSLLAQANATMLTVESRLLQMQALLLYQFMRLSDGDSRQLANAERDFETLETWTVDLHQTYTAYSNELSWESVYHKWVLFESVRRTIMMSVVLLSIYSAAKDGVCYLVPFLTGLPVSTNARLWKAPKTDWLWVAGQIECNVISYGEYVNEWNSGKIVTIDGYEKLLLVACRHAAGTSWLLS